jgi:hypothetical protein
MNAPLSAPAEVPTITSGAIARSESARSIPTWIAPRPAPPERTKPIGGRRVRVMTLERRARVHEV